MESRSQDLYNTDGFSAPKFALPGNTARVSWLYRLSCNISTNNLKITTFRCTSLCLIIYYCHLVIFFGSGICSWSCWYPSAFGYHHVYISVGDILGKMHSWDKECNEFPKVTVKTESWKAGIVYWKVQLLITNYFSYLYYINYTLIFFSAVDCWYWLPLLKAWFTTTRTCSYRVSACKIHLIS